MLDFTVQQSALRLGLAEGVEPHQTPPGTLTTAENLSWRKGGKLEKRYGVRALVQTILGGGSIASAIRLFTRGSELCLVDGSNLYAYSSSLSSWKTVDSVPTAGLTWTTALDALSGVMAVDEAISAAGLTVVAWVVGDPNAGAYGATGAVRFMVRGSNGEVLIPATDANTGTNHLVRVLTIGTTAYVFMQNTTSIIATTINLATLAITTLGAIVSNVKVQGWDACVIGSNIVFAYEDTGGGLKLKSVNSALAGVATGSISGEAGTSIQCISIDGLAGESLYVAYYVSSSTLVRIACADNATLVQTVAPVTLETLTGVGRNASKVGVTRYNTTSALVAWSAFGGTTTASFRTSSVKFTLAGAIDATVSGRTYGAGLITRPFMLGTGCYALFCDRPTNAGASGTHTVLLKLDAGTSTNFPHRYIGKSELLVSGFTVPGAVARSAAISSSAVQCPAPFVASNSTAGTVFRQGIRLVTVSIGTSLPSDMWRSVTFGDEAYIGAGVLSASDGQRVFDYGFEREPLTISTSTAAGSVVIGTYLYSWVREFRSAAGVLHRSPAGIPSTVIVSGANKDVSLVQLTGPISNKQTVTTLTGAGSSSPVLVAGYRTVVGGSTLQRLTVEPTYNVILTDSSAPEETYLDNDPDANIGNTQTLASRPPLYTTGGILDDFQPVGCVTLCYHADRLWTLAGDQKTWWYSKTFQDDLGTAPGFHPNFRIVFAEPQVGAASMEDKAIFFSASGLRYLLGVGPTPNGQNSDFQGPFPVQSDVGCTSARSIVSTPDGTMFLSDRGLYLVSRGLDLVWLGRPVKDTLEAFPVVTSAVLVAKQNQVRFTCNDVAGTTGCVLVYDYVEKQWTTYRYGQASAGGSGLAIADACMWNGAWTFVTPGGVVYSEDSTTCRDAGSWVYQTLEFAWLNAGGPLSFQSVRQFSIRGVSYTDHDLTVSVGFDDDPSYPQTVTFLAQTPVTSVGVEECSVTIGTRRKCNAIRFKVTDRAPSSGTLGTGQGPAFDMIGLEVGNKRGFGNTPATKKG